MDEETVLGGFYRDCTGAICNEPMQLGGRHVRTESVTGDIDPGQKCFGFFQVCALVEDPWDQFKLRYIVLSVVEGCIMGIAHKVQPSHGKALLVKGVKIQGIVLGHASHAEDGVALVGFSAVAEA